MAEALIALVSQSPPRIPSVVKYGGDIGGYRTAMTEPIECPDCKTPNDYWRAHCRRCGWLLGFPNRRAAEAERPELVARYYTACKNADSHNTLKLLEKAEALAEASRPVIAMSFAACDDLLRPGKYRNYDQRVGSGEREPARAADHSNREMVGQRLYPMYSQHIAYAALSPDGRGLSSYGPIALRWQVTPNYLGRRSSLLEENSYTFYNRFSLGPLNATIPGGYRAVWEDRARLVAAKLEPRITIATAENELPQLLLHEGGRPNDDFVEIAIYADGGLDTEDVDMVTVQRPATTSEEHHRMELILEACANRGVELVA